MRIHRERFGAVIMERARPRACGAEATHGRGRPCSMVERGRARLCLAVLVTCLGLAVLPRPCSAADLASLLPDSVAGWRLQGKPASYTRDTLFDYIDGGADFYLGYGFRRVLVAEYTGFGAEKITAELYDMGSSHDAFGVFAHDRSPTGPAVGQESSWAGGLLTFWKARLFARLFSDRDSERAREAILRLGKAISTALRATGRKPPLVRLLPAAGLAPASVRYLHTDTALNSLVYLPGNPLQLGHDTNLAYGEYPQAAAKHPQAGGKPVKFAVVAYPDGPRARDAFAGLARLLGEKGQPSAALMYARSTDRYGAVASVASGNYVGFAWNAPDTRSVRRLIDAMLVVAKRTWREVGRGGDAHGG